MLCPIKVNSNSIELTIHTFYLGFHSTSQSLVQSAASCFPSYPYHLAAAAAAAAALASSQSVTPVKRSERDQLEEESPSSTTQEPGPVNLSPKSRYINKFILDEL